MKTNLFICFFFILTLSSSLNERKLIKYIDSTNLLALSHYKSNDITQSFNYLIETVKLSDSINDYYGNAEANFTLGNIYSYLGLYSEAERCFTKMLEQSQKIDDNFLIANSHMSLAELYRNNKPIETVILYFEKALQYALKNDVRDQNNLDKQQSILFDLRMRLSYIYIEKNDINEAYINLLKAENNLTDLYSMAYLSYTYGLYFMNQQSYNLANNKFTEALKYLEKNNSAVEDSNIDLLVSNVYKKLSQSLSKLGNNDDAYNILLKYNSNRERLINEEKVKQEKIAKSKFFIAEYKQIAQSAINERLHQQKISNEIKIVNTTITIVIIVLIVLLLFLVKNYRSKQKLSIILKERNVHLEIAKDEAEEASQLKMAFLSNVTHELRTPLYGVVGLTSLMLENNSLSKEDNKLLNSLKYSGDYLLNLVNDILQLGKMESEKVELKNVSVNLKELISSIIGSFEYRLQESNNQIHVLIDDSIPEFIECDSVRLSQILINLIGNSIKFTENGKIWLRVITKNINNNKVNLRFEVEDNGAGIPENKHKIIFEKFSQLNNNSNVNYQGSGLGLSIVNNLVELFNSEIELESELGKGSTFSFNATFNIDKYGLDNTKIKKSGKIVPLNKNYKILVAEDNKINQIVTRNILEKSNFECEIVQNGLECVNAVKENTYDLILMDINMPIMNGNEATIEIRKTHPQIPIIALTAADLEEVKNDFDSIGYNGIITKPFDNCEFLQVITASIQKSKLNSNYNSKLVKVS